MRLPAPLLRRDRRAYKNQFGHVLILAGSRTMIGAAALSGLAAMRTGAGLVTLGIPQSLNDVIQKKISPVLMTFPLKETREQTIDAGAYFQIQKRINDFDVVALGPGLSKNSSTQKFVQKIIKTLDLALVIDADALYALSVQPEILLKTRAQKILTPHPGEMADLTGLKKSAIETNRPRAAQNFAEKYRCVLLLKGFQTVVASADGKVYINRTGNSGMASAGSGDVLTGMIAALLGQGLNSFEAAKWGACLHGLAGDLAAKKKTRAAMIASDIIDHIPEALKRSLLGH